MDRDERRYLEQLSIQNTLVQTRKAVQIYWFFMPPNLGDELQSRLLFENTVVWSEHPSSQKLMEVMAMRLGDAAGHPNCFALLNLDRLLLLLGAKKAEDIHKACRMLCAHLRAMGGERVLVHTTYIDQALKNLFFESGIFLVQKNFSDEATAIFSLQKLIPVFAPDSEAERRGYMRIIPEERIRVKITLPRLGEEDVISGTLHDFSLNGLSIDVSSGTMDRLIEKDLARLQIFLPRIVVRISVAALVRKREGINQVSFFFNPDDSRMIGRSEAHLLAQYILYHIKLLKKHRNSPQSDVPAVPDAADDRDLVFAR